MLQTAIASQLPVPVVFRWYRSDPVNLEITVLNLDWSGTYLGTVGDVDLTVTATYDGANTKFLFQLTDEESDHVYGRNHPVRVWNSVTGLTRFAGTAEVRGASS